MKKIYQALFAALFSILLGTAHAQLADNNFPAQQTSENTKKLAEYVLNLGAYLGYNVAQKPDQAQSTLLNVNKALLANNYSLNTFLGAVPLVTVGQVLAKIVPQDQADIGWLNNYTNRIFQPAYNQPAVKQGKVSVNPLIDQQAYQLDPVSQYVLNKLATPDDSFCMSQSGKYMRKDCQLLYQSLVTSNVIGEIPSTNEFFSYQYLASVLPQLNSNTLLAPLLYDEKDPQADSTGSPRPEPETKGLRAKNQAQEAANFIRYASGAVVPPKLPSKQAYDNAYLKIQPGTGANDRQISSDQAHAKAVLTKYLAQMRSYAARMSVASANLNYLFSKRMPQKQDAQGDNIKSQALSEFTMATRRLYNLDMSENQQWLNEIDKASPATVQKEIALLLAEMNYQLYLNRQQSERILLTETMMLMISAEMNAPDSELSS